MQAFSPCDAGPFPYCVQGFDAGLFTLVMQASPPCDAGLFAPVMQAFSVSDAGLLPL